MQMSVIEWLLDSDPSIRWQVMRDLIGESDAAVARERSRVASEGWGARLLDLRRPTQPAIVVPHDDLRARRTAGVRDGEGSEARRYWRSPSRTGVLPRAAPVPIAINRTDHHRSQNTGQFISKRGVYGRVDR